jgi:hypothetical protein
VQSSVYTVSRQSESAQKIWSTVDVPIDRELFVLSKSYILTPKKKEISYFMSLPNSRYGVYSSHCHRRIFVTKVHLAEEAKFYKYIRVSNPLLKIILQQFFDVRMRKIYTDSGNAVIDIGLNIYFISYLGTLVFCNHF